MENQKPEKALSIAPEAKSPERIRVVTEQVVSALSNTIVGQEENIRFLWSSLLMGGHILLEGVPGLGKTLLVRALTQVVACEFQRVQFTPDLMPSDVTGNKVYDLQTGQFTYHKGPIFTNVLLADEIEQVSYSNYVRVDI